MEQRSVEWFADRAGRFGASELAALMAKKGTATRDNKIAQKVAERLTGVCEAGFTSSAMQWGIDHEDEARDQYFLASDNYIEDEGFVRHPDPSLYDWTGASPDGLVESDGLVEIKCPNTATHISYLRKKKVPSNYMYQMQWQMACTGRKWCDFVSYDPRMPERLQLLVIHVPRDDLMIAKLEIAVSAAIEEVQQIINEIDGGNTDG